MSGKVGIVFSVGELEDFKGKLTSIDDSRLYDEDINEFIGISKGLLVNGNITDEAIKMLKNWIKANEYAAKVYPLDIVRKTLSKIKIKDIQQQDRENVFELLTKIVGGEQLVVNQSSKLPLNEPQPEIEIKDHTFCFTGTFSFAPRDVIKQKVIELGGKVIDRVTTKLDYLVIGDLASDGWAHSSYGRKIEEAVRFRKKFKKPCILSEASLTKHF